MLALDRDFDEDDRVQRNRQIEYAVLVAAGVPDARHVRGVESRAQAEEAVGAAADQLHEIDPPFGRLAQRRRAGPVVGPWLLLRPASCALVRVAVPAITARVSPAAFDSVDPAGKPEMVTLPIVSGPGPLTSVGVTVIDSGIACPCCSLLPSAIAARMAGAV